MSTEVVAPQPPASAERDLTFKEQVRLFIRFFVYLRPYRDKVVLGILLMFVGVPLGQVGNFLNRYLWDNVLLSADRPTDQRLSLFFAIVGLQALMWVIS